VSPNMRTEGEANAETCDTEPESEKFLV